MHKNKMRIHMGSHPLSTAATKLRHISWVLVTPRSQERKRSVEQRRLIGFRPVSTMSRMHKLSPGSKNGLAPMN